MLKPAIQYKEALQKAITNIWFSEKYKYWNADTYWTIPDIDDSSWSQHQFVSVYNEEVVGYISYSIVRTANRVTNLNIINFTDNIIIFGKDLFQALTDIFEQYRFNKLTFTVVVGNPIEESYDKFVSKYGGRIVGVYRQHARLHDNQLYDEKLYEICREDYLKSCHK